MRALLMLSVLVLLAVAPLEAAREIEPNNHWLQATLIDGAEPVAAALNDEQDVYKLLLPEAGEVTITLDRFPEGVQLTLDILGFRNNPIVPINQVKNRGRNQLTATFHAQERLGYLSLSATPVEKVCKDQWCIMRLVSSGPYYLLQPGPTLPPDWNGHPILDPPEYRLTIVHPEITRRQRQEEASRQAVAKLPLFKESTFGLQFRHPPDWTPRTDSARRIVVTPDQPSGEYVQIVVGIRDKAVFPGSSPELQLNLAEKTLRDANALIVKRGTMTVMQRDTPFILGNYPDSARAATIAHLQLVLDDSDQYYWISYTAPEHDYADFISGFATILKTLDIKRPGL